MRRYKRDIYTYAGIDVELKSREKGIRFILEPRFGEVINVAPQYRLLYVRMSSGVIGSRQ